ncbi:MAG: LysR family transcriptional regulator [Lachnospiraceae bacterium]|nr:LysR family transcriptional regulator [Lachnospiraceae bacterium]
MNINYFHEFVTLCETMNYTEAAERLFISQASLSKHIQYMEKELDEALFIRSTRKLELTEYGKLFLPDAIAIAEHQKSYLEKLQQQKAVDSALLKIGSTPALSQYGLTELFSEFSSHYPEIRFSLFSADDELLLSALTEQRCSIIIARVPALLPGHCTTIPIITDEMCVALSQNHRLAQQSKLTLDQLQNEKFILFKADTFVSNFIETLFNKEGFSLSSENIVGRFLSFYTILDFVKKGLGITVVSRQTAHFFAGDSVAVIPLSPCVPFDLCLAYSKNQLLSKTERLFIRYAKNHFLIET